MDNAACSFTSYQEVNSLNCGVASIISFHHTKPIGFGEGGAIIIDVKYEQTVRNIINFGYDMVKLDQLWSPHGSNYKMSDVAAAYILQYFDDFETIRSHHQRLYQRFAKAIVERSGVRLFPNFSSDVPFVSSLVVVFDRPVNLDLFVDSNIEVKKYYKPLVLAGRALDLYNRIACFPCHIDMCERDVDRVLKAIDDVLAT